MNDFQPSIELINFIKQPNVEGQVLVPYTDPAGFLTWGSGHKAKPGEQVPSTLTPEQSDAILMADLQIAGAAVRSLVTVEMTQAQFDGCTDFTFNLGKERLAGSTMLQFINRGDWAGAADECLKWDHGHVAGKLVELAGLKARRQWDAAHMTPESATAETTIVNVPVLRKPDGYVMAPHYNPTPQELEAITAASVAAAPKDASTDHAFDERLAQIKAEVAADEAGAVQSDPTVAPYTPPAPVEPQLLPPLLPTYTPVADR